MTAGGRLHKVPATVAAGLWGPLQPSRDTLPPGHRPLLLAVLLASFVLRFGLAWLSPNIHQADEVYQAAEQANRAVHGFGIVSWEFRAAARPALLPSLVEPIFLLNVSAATRQALVAALFTALSLIPVWVAFHWAGRLYGARGGALAAVMMGTWFELVYFAPKPTADAVCAYFLLAAVFLARPAAGARAVLLAGFSLMLALGIRMQIAPAIGVVLLLTAAVDWRSRVLPLLAGVISGLALVGAVEWLWWGIPFRGHWGYLTMEFVHGASTYFGREPVTFFAKNYVLIYGAALPAIALLAYWGARTAPVLPVTALALVIPFHLVGHKEYRFLVPAIPVLVMLMGLATADLVARFDRAATVRRLSIGIAAWLVAMTSVTLGDAYRPFWIRDRNHIWAFREIGKQPDACGVALVAIRWFHTPGYSGLGRDIPIYETGRDPLSPHLAAAANYVLVAHKAPVPPEPYVEWLGYSRPEEHVYRRPGGCVPDDPAKIVRPPGIPGIPE